MIDRNISCTGIVKASHAKRSGEQELRYEINCIILIV